MVRRDCPACGGEIVIPKIGKDLTRCRRCGAEAPIDAKFCMECGAAVGDEPTMPVEAVPPPIAPKTTRLPIVGQPQIPPKCQYCDNPLSPGAVICVHCGTDLRTGKRLTAATAARQKQTGPLNAGSEVRQSTTNKRGAISEFGTGLLKALGAVFLIVVGISIVMSVVESCGERKNGSSASQVSPPASPANARDAVPIAARPSPPSPGRSQSWSTVATPTANQGNQVVRQMSTEQLGQYYDDTYGRIGGVYETEYDALKRSRDILREEQRALEHGRRVNYFSPSIKYDAFTQMYVVVLDVR